jgi:hypothetical protein
MLIFELDSFPIEQVCDLLAFERRLGDWAAGITYPIRLLVSSRPFSMRAAIQRIDAQLALSQRWYALARRLLPAIHVLADGEIPDPHPAHIIEALERPLRTVIEELCAVDFPMLIDAPALVDDEQWFLFGAILEQLIWPTPYLKETRTFYEILGERHVRSAGYHIVTFEPPNVQAEAISASLRHATGREVRVVEHLPPMIDGPVQVDEGRARLLPTRPGGRYYALLRSYDLVGEMDATILHTLLDLPFDLSIAVDIQTLSTVEATRKAEWVYSAAQVAIRDGSIKDTRSEQRLIDAEQVLHELRTQTIHETQIAVLVSAESAEELEIRKATVRDRLGSTMKFEAVRGSQAELLKLFSTLPASRIDAAWARSSLLSHGVGCLLGVVGYFRPQRDTGLLWGIDAMRSAPLFYDLFGDNQAGHITVIGQSGSGKTFFLNCMTIRAATQLGYRVVWVDAFHNGPRIQQAAGAGGRCYTFRPDETINLLDLAYSPDDGASWVSSQVQHVLSQLALLMGDIGMSAEGKRRLLPRTFTKTERGYLERALKHLYRYSEPGDPTPILDDLVLGLEAIAEDDALSMARELRAMLYGSVTSTESLTVVGESFNGQTTVDWNIVADVTCFDLSEIQSTNEEMVPFYYAQVVSALYRYMRDTYRDRTRKTLVIIDEFGLAAQVEAIGQMAATMTKVARKYGIGMVLVDQNPLTFLDSTTGNMILENCRVKVLFRMDERPARRMAEALPDLTALHVEQLVNAERGYAVAVFQNDVTYMAIEPTARELRMLQGS